MSIMKKELSFYKATGQKSATLERLYKALLTIKPSSVESERAFSTTGFFMTKLRTRMSDENLGMLMYLKFHFLALQRRLVELQKE